MDPEAAAQRWAETWRTAWEDLDTEAIVALYAPGVVFSSEPFRTPYRGRDGVRAYVSGAFAVEKDVHVNMAPPVVDGRMAVVSWWASLVEERADATLAGTSVLRFDTDGLVVEQWDTWNMATGRREPPTDWSPFAAH